MPNELNTTPENTIAAPDLTKRPPRSPRCRLGGYVILPRMLDKGRATIAGKNGEYAPFDQHIVSFLGIDVEALKTQVAAGLGDGEILAWLNDNAVQKRTPWEIAQWSEHMLRRGPDSDEETLIFFLPPRRQLLENARGYSYLDGPARSRRFRRLRRKTVVTVGGLRAA